MLNKSQPNGPQAIESTRKNCDTMLPGMVSPVVNAFYDRRRRLTTRGVERRLHIPATFVDTALFWQFRDEIDELRKTLEMVLERKGPQSETTVRERLQIVRRVA